MFSHQVLSIQQYNNWLQITFSLMGSRSFKWPQGLKVVGLQLRDHRLNLATASNYTTSSHTGGASMFAFSSLSNFPSFVSVFYSPAQHLFSRQDPNEDTEWNDILRKKGILPPKEVPKDEEEEELALQQQSVGKRDGLTRISVFIHF